MQHYGTQHSATSNLTALVGSFHTFGEHGVLYEVLEAEEGRERALIRVVETGETLRYPLADIANDPKAN